MVTRTLDAPDAEDFVRLLEALDAETRYLMFEPGERPVDIRALRARLADRRPDNGVLYALVDDAPHAAPRALRDGSKPVDGPPVPRRTDEPLVGFIGAQRRQGRRNRHVLNLVVAIRQSRTGRGHGRALLDAVERYARNEGVTRLELTVMVDNVRAIRLYEGAAFEREGVRRRAVRLEDGWHDEYAYAKLLDPGERGRS